MIKGKILKISIVAFLIGFVIIGKAFCFSAEVESLGGGKYFPKLKEGLKNAKSSIYVVMYCASFNPRHRKSAVYQLAQELVNAHKRGVKVKVILDQNIPYWAWEEKGRERKVEGKNEPLFIFLKQQGVEVYYDNKMSLVHSKVIVIDKDKVILGSTNWTPSALYRNYETSVLIESPELAEELIKDFSKIVIDNEASILDEEKESPVSVSMAFLKDPSLAGAMVTVHDENTFDLYLLLLKEFDGNPEGEVDFDYRKVARFLKVEQDYKVYRNSILRMLKRLHGKYKLIELKSRQPKSPYIRLLNYPDKTPYKSPADKFFSIPGEYWKWGWSKRLTFSEKYCYFIGLYKTTKYRRPWWKDYIVALSGQFNVGKAVITKGMMGLRKRNIIDIEYSENVEGGYAKKEPTRFRFLGLYSSEKLEEQIERLKGAYGKESVKKARAYAQIVYKENDIRIIEEVIKKTDQYGEELMNEAFTCATKMEPHNRRRSYRYVVGILKRKAAKEE